MKLFFGKTNEQIDAKSGTTLGKGGGTLKKWTSATADTIEDSALNDLTFYNPWEDDDVASGADVLVAEVMGRLVIISVLSCDDLV